MRFFKRDATENVVHSIATFGGSRIALVSNKTYEAALEAAKRELRKEEASHSAERTDEREPA